MLTAGATLGFLPNLGPMEYLIIGGVMLLLFGRRLPEVGRSLGQGIVQFKKGLKDIEEDVNQAADREPAKFENAKTPLNASGEDVRVSRGEGVETPAGEAGVRPAGS